MKLVGHLSIETAYAVRATIFHFIRLSDAVPTKALDAAHRLQLRLAELWRVTPFGTPFLNEESE